jgi:hypothetical protein
MSKMPHGSIEWTKITPRMKVVRKHGDHPDHFTGKPNSWYESAGRLVIFGSRDQRQAQVWLERRVRSDATKFRRKQ